MKVCLALAAIAIFGLTSTCKSRTETAALKVVGGEPTLEREFPASFYIPSCSAVRISSRHFLTAAHCVLNQSEFRLLAQYQPGHLLSVWVGPELVSARRYEVRVVRTYVHKSFESSVNFGGEQESVDVADLAVVEVDGFPVEIEQASIDGRLLTSGQEVVFTGYGCEVIPAYMRRRPGEYVLARAELSNEERNLRFKKAKVTLLEHEGQVGLIANSHSGGSYVDPTRRSSEFSGCPGDSGSGVYLPEVDNMGRKTKIVGINSFINQYRTAFSRLDKEAPLNTFTCFQHLFQENASQKNERSCFVDLSAR
jgi:hypothetical protein